MKRKIKKTGVGFIGGVVLVAGIIMIPYPGPGWVTVFLGLGILFLGLGLLALAFSAVFYGRFLPFLIRSCTDAISRLFHRRRGRL